VIPLQVGVLQFPIPTARRCYDLGRALGRAIESYDDDDLDVAVVATGGLSHQVHGERAGFNNVEWDEQFLDLLENEPDTLAAMTHAEYAELGGLEGAEVIMWLVMRGALSGSVRRRSRATYLPSMTDLATLVLDHDHEVDADEVAEHRRLAGAQLAGIDKIPGTHPFTLERAHAAYQLNDFLHRLVEPEVRQRFLDDAASAYDDFDLTGDERRMIDERDWIGLIHAGAIFFGLEKLASVLGLSNADVYAQMRGETLEQFQATRRTALKYSVAAGEQQ
jgi:gallate dioxygenase